MSAATRTKSHKIVRTRAFQCEYHISEFVRLAVTLSSSRALRVSGRVETPVLLDSLGRLPSHIHMYTHIALPSITSGHKQQVCGKYVLAGTRSHQPSFELLPRSADVQ